MDYAYETLAIALTEGVATVALDRPDKFNAISRRMIDELTAAFERLRLDAGVRTIVLTGNGKAFCSGGDVGEIGAVGGGGALEMTDFVSARTFSKMLLAIHHIEKPVICALNGIAAGAGTGLALLCDVIYASETARFSEIFSRIGAVPDTGNMWLLPRLVGPNKAKELCFSGEIIDAPEMYRLGIAQKLFAPDELLPATLAFAKKLAKGAPLSYRLTKTVIDRAWNMSFEEFIDLEALSIESFNRSEDFREGIAAFVEKREPRFKGK